MKKVKMVCETCGGEDVRRDASVAWDTETQTWELVAVYDSATCETCDTDEATLLEVEK